MRQSKHTKNRPHDPLLLTVRTKRTKCPTVFRAITILLFINFVLAIAGLQTFLINDPYVQQVAQAAIWFASGDAQSAKATSLLFGGGAGIGSATEGVGAVLSSLFMEESQLVDEEPGELEDEDGDATNLDELSILHGLDGSEAILNDAMSAPKSGLEKSSKGMVSKSLKAPPSIVTVVGAGLAGLLATLETLNNVPSAIVVLVEGGDVVGGRVANVNVPSNNKQEPSTQASSKQSKDQNNIDSPMMVEVGATFIHGIEDNPLIKLARHYKLATTPVNYDSVQVIESATGAVFDTRFVDAVKSNVYNVARRIFFFLRDQRLKEGLSDVALDSLFKEATYIALHGLNSTTAQQSASTNNDDFEGFGEGMLSSLAQRRTLLRSLRVPSIESALTKLLDIQPFSDEHYRALTRRNRKASLSDIEQVLSWHFYWEIVQDQIAPLHDLGSFAYDRSLGFRGSDHVFDNPRGIQALIDALMADLATAGGISKKDKDHHLIFTNCSDVAKQLSLLRKDFRGSSTPRRLIISLNCSVSQITDNQLPSVQLERKSELQTILNNKRLAHRKELLGGDGKLNAATTKDAQSSQSPSEHFESAVSGYTGSQKQGTSTEEKSTASRQPYHLINPFRTITELAFSSISVPLFALAMLVEVVDSISWLVISNIGIPALQTVFYATLWIINSIATTCDFIATCYYFSSSSHNGCESWSKYLSSGNGEGPKQSGYFDPEEAHARYFPQPRKINTSIVNLLPHALRSAAMERSEMRNRLLKGEDPLLDRSEVMAERKRMGSERVRLNSVDITDDDDDEGGNQGYASAAIRKAKRKYKPAPKPEERLNNNNNNNRHDAMRDTSPVSSITNYIFHSFSLARRKVITVLRNSRRQYRLIVKRPTSFINKATFLLKNPFAAVQLLLLEEPMIATLVEAGGIESQLSGENGFSLPMNTNFGQTQILRAVSGIRTSTDVDPATAWWDSDVVVVTVPLGVLQKSLSLATNFQNLKAQTQQSVGLNTPQSTSPHQLRKKAAIRFTPPLPLSKHEAVTTTGCSEALKMAVQFETTSAPFWPNDVEFFGISVGNQNVHTTTEIVDPLLEEKSFSGLRKHSYGVSQRLPHSYIFGDAAHIEIVNLHKFRKNGVLILEVENELARHWSSFTNQTQLIESEVMPRLRSAFCPASHLLNSSSCRVPSMPLWFAINNYLRNPHIRCGFSYWKPGHDGRDNLALREGLWPDTLIGGSSQGYEAHALASTAHTLFSPLIPSHTHHPYSVKERLKNGMSSTSGSAVGSLRGGHRLLFAGEHTSPDLYGNMHGAVVEGQRAALEVKMLLDQREEHFVKRLQFWRHTTIGRLLLSAKSLCTRVIRSLSSGSGDSFSYANL